VQSLPGQSRDKRYVADKGKAPGTVVERQRGAAAVHPRSVMITCTVLSAGATTGGTSYLQFNLLESQSSPTQVGMWKASSQQDSCQSCATSSNRHLPNSVSCLAITIRVDARRGFNYLPRWVSAEWIGPSMPVEALSQLSGRRPKPPPGCFCVIGVYGG